MNDGHISQDDLTLYAMQALSPEESAAVRAHVAGCAECREELATLHGDLALVAMSVEEQTLPVGARERLMDRIAASAPEVESRSTGRVMAFESGRRKPLVRSWLTWGAVAALLIVTIGLGVQVESLRRLLATERADAQAHVAETQRAKEVLDLLTARGAQHVMLTASKTPPAPSARAVYLPSRGSLVLQASNLNPLPRGKAYELWVIPANGSAPVPAGVFQPDAAGSASLVLPKIPQGVTAKAFGITIEDEGGSPTPTLPIVLAGAAPAAGE